MSATAVQERTIDIEGLRTRYLTAGDDGRGPPLVLVHGVGTSAGEWSWVLPYGQAPGALARLNKGSLRLVPNCGHLPHVERPERFVSILDGFLRNGVRGRAER